VEHSVLVQSIPVPYPQVARPVHTVIVLAALAVGVLWSYILADQMRVSINPDRMQFYLHGLIFEWLVFALVVEGVRRSGTPVVMVLGNRWHSAYQVLRDIGIAAAFWTISIFLLVIFGRLLHITALGRNIRFVYPQGRVELIVWMALSITAGICEETIFRGYLQRQFIAMTKSVPAGIFISAVAFGAGHAYQGFRRALLLGLYGAGFGILAHWRKNVRPGMMAHSWQDLLAGVLSTAIRR
jgi:membrane protease YdiL (CAAX protease family)